ncbi:regulatory protein suaprga1 [Mycena albidolilacea]|uniref:Regulatory protein suaprga1 n=1 Tax=Mycena albidolilacea TaxID=1033008 RepID=A0AAD7EBR5_9AGAR|nr:regulatory protein suaprga1 [Mycena albidolilacea]
MSALRTVRQLTKLRPVLRAARPTVGVVRSRGFAVSAPALKSGNKLASSSSATTLLAQKLRAEISYEAEVQQDDLQVSAVPQDLVEFLQEGEWEIKDTPANDEVFLTRRFGDESIRVMFSIADLQSIPDEDEPEGTDDESPARGDEPALRVSVAITKSTHPGALHADLYCADGAFDVANVAYYKDARIATELSIASDWERRTLWTGPLFESLDPALNEAFEAYLRERGVDGALAGFVPRYALWKEQREYLEWLHGVEGFVKA